MTDSLDLLDPLFSVQVLGSTPRPNLLCYLAMHQDYAEHPTFNDYEKLSQLSEAELGERLIRNCINKKHWGILEHPSITLNVINFPHSVMVQARTHRVGLCLSGETKIRFGHRSLSEGQAYYEQDLKSLADLWHHGRKHQRTKADAEYMQKQIKDRAILVLDTNSNKIVRSRIVDIYCNGVKEVYELKTLEGHKIKATLDHLFWTNQGWIKLKDFDSSTQVCTPEFKGQEQSPKLVTFNDQELNSEKWKRIPSYPLFEVSTLGRVRSYASKGGRGQFPKCDLKPSIKKLSKAKNYLFTSVFNHSFDKGVYKRVNVHTLVLETFCPHPHNSSNLECRHLNGNKYDNRLENLQWGTSKENSQDNIFNNSVACNRGRFTKVESILPAGKEETYDIEVAHESHNFIGNGLVVHNSFDCQSQRYTSQRILRLAEQLQKNPQQYSQLIEEVFYFRKIGHYFDREGNKYFYSPEHREKDIIFTQKAIAFYADKVNQEGHAPEHARDLLTQNIRQHFVVSFNARSLLHFCDLRLPKDAQPEIRNMAELLFREFAQWMPEVAAFYSKKRMGKNLLAP